MRTLDDLLKELKVDNASTVTVGRLAAYGLSGDPRAASEMAAGRLGKWGATAGGVHMVITPDEGRLLIQHGATEQAEPMFD